MSFGRQFQASSFGGGLGWRRRPANRAVALIINVVFVVLGIAGIIVGHNRWEAVQPIAGGRTTTGTVVSVVNGESCGRYGCSPNWTPTIKFETPAGVAQTFVGPLYSSSIATGQTVRVSYDPADPAVAHDISASGSGGLLLIGGGALFIIVGAVSFILGLERLHRRTGLSSARQGSGWVGQAHIHSNAGIAIAIVAILVLAAVGLLIL